MMPCASHSRPGTTRRPGPYRFARTTACAGHGRGSRKELLMSIPPKVLAAAATLTVAGGLAAVGTLPASAATPQCGPHCIQIFSSKFGTNATPNFVETVFGGAGTAGQ